MGIAELDRLGGEIAELSAQLDAATARLLDLIREFDAHGVWTNGFRSCADWLSWRVGLAGGPARVARGAPGRGLRDRRLESPGEQPLRLAKGSRPCRVRGVEKQSPLFVTRGLVFVPFEQQAPAVDELQELDVREARNVVRWSDDGAIGERTGSTFQQLTDERLTSHAPD